MYKIYSDGSKYQRSVQLFNQIVLPATVNHFDVYDTKHTVLLLVAGIRRIYFSEPAFLVLAQLR